MRVFIAGIDGYLGWSLAKHLIYRGHEVTGVDVFARRSWVQEMKSDSATPVAGMPERLAALREKSGKQVGFAEGDLRDYDFVLKQVQASRPDVIVHLGECPSAPYSMIDVHHATYVQVNNIVSTFHLMHALKEVSPGGHLLKLGTMGEYGTPNLDIPEGYFEVEYRGRKDRLSFPRQAGSFYHQSKVHSTHNIQLACKVWGIGATDVMQGVVFGTRIDAEEADERLLTRLDFDEAFGTAINRFCCQAVIGHPLTLFGSGGQVRGFLPLRDSMQCLTLALENPPSAGECRVFNQFEEVYGLTELARKVKQVAAEFGLQAEIRNTQNPRKEMEKHYYHPDHQHLLDLGYRPTHDMESEIRVTMKDLLRYRNRIEANKEVLLPHVHWDGSSGRVSYLQNAQAGK